LQVATRQAAGENVRMIKSPLEATTITTTTTNCWQLGRSTARQAVRQSGRKVSQRELDDLVCQKKLK